LEEASLAELIEAGPVSIVDKPMYTLLLARPTTKDSASTVWIAAKCDMDLDPNDILFSFGTGRRLKALLTSLGENVWIAVLARWFV
jgi:hypothetical protein